MHVIARRSLRPAGYLVSVFCLIPAQAGALNVDLLMTDSGQKAGNQYGISAASAGDFNGDGYDDVIVGANAYAASTGRAYVYFGGPGSDNTPDVILNGETTYGGFGQSVGAAGDVNGDGYDDIIVGAPVADFPSNEGAAYVFFGGAAPDSIYDLRLVGHAASERLGISVGTAGDVNNDGYPDLIVGAYGALSNTGRAYLYFGGASPDTVPDVTFVGDHTNDRFGRSVSTAGDVDGDGYADVVIGTYASTGSGDDRGLAYLYYGGAAMDSLPDLTFHGEASDDLFGSDVAGGGDANGDGYDDIIVGAEGNDAGGAEAGRAYLFLGGPGADSTADVVITGLSAGDALGHSVGFAGDLNLDGADDFLVGAPEKDEGTVYFFYGGPGPNSTADAVLLGESLGDNFGQDAGSAGDFDGDGTSDIIVGAFLAGAGKAYVYDLYSYHVLYPNGGETWLVGENETIEWKGSDLADLYISYDGGSNWSLISVGVGGLPANTFYLPVPSTATNQALIRVNYSGAPLNPFNGDISDGTFEIVEPYVPPVSDCDPWWDSNGEGSGDGFGRALGSVGDFNQDGYEDIVVGAPWNAAGGAEAGRAYLYLGGATPDPFTELIMTGEAAGDQLGHAVASAGDFNNDGYADLIVGAYHNDAGGAEAGRAYLYLGGMTPDTSPDAIFTGPATLRNLGWSVGTAGDVNGDGYDDLILGAVGDSSDANQPGWAYLYLGGASPDTTPDLVLTGEAMGDRFGTSVGTTGDIDGDGYDDFLVGAVHAGGDSGRVYVYHGGPGLDAVPDLVLTGEAAGDLFGISAATGGDVNGDGYDDVIVGAAGSDSMGTDGGRAYLYLGGPTIDEVPDVVCTSPIFNANFGRSVGTAGDPNGDGYSDVIVGAPLAGVQDEGQVYIFYGGPNPDNQSDLSWYGTLANAEFGFAVSTGGDMTGDGLSDILFGCGAQSDASLWDCGPDPVGVADVDSRPTRLAFAPVSPNPMSSGRSLEARFTLPAGDTVVAFLFDLQGRRISSSGPRTFEEAGEHRIRWTPESLPAGIYFLQIRTAAGLRASRTLCVLK